MISSKGSALLIGVDDYSAFDPAMSLKGSREDVLKLYWMCRRLLGLSRENIRVLASPPLTAADFHVTEPPPPDRMGPATAESIQAGVDWLAGRMASDAAAAGLLTYSGHGSYSQDRGPLLCPSDMGRDFAKGIAVRDLSKSQALQSVRERLTVMLDCCHVAPVTTASDFRAPTALPHDGTPEQVAADHADFDVSERVLLAARPGQHAHQALLGKVFHGALTFALVTVAEQWKASQDPDGSGMDVSYKQLLKRVRRMLWSLRMKQSVRLRVPEAPMSKRKAIRKLPFFGIHAATTARRPDAPRDGIQLDPTEFGCLYTITGSGLNAIQIFSVPAENPPTGYTAGKEYWSVPTMPSSGNWPTSISFAATPNQASRVPTGFAPNGNTSYPTASSVAWPAASSSPPGVNGGVYFAQTTDADGKVASAFALDLSSLSSGTWIWYYWSASGSAPTGFIDVSQLSFQSALPTNPSFPTTNFSKLSQP